MKKKSGIPLYAKIFIGMIAGIIFGIIMSNLGYANIIEDWIAPWGEIFMRLLKFIAIPLVLLSLIKGISNLGNIRSLSTMGFKTILIYLLTTILAILIGLALVELFSPGSGLSGQSVKALQQSYGEMSSSPEEMLQSLSEQSPLQQIVNIFPDNLFASLSNNDVMLQVIFISLIFGIAILYLGTEKMRPVMELINSLEHLVLKVVDIIMEFAPIGVFALLAGTVVSSRGDMSLLAALGGYALTVATGLMVMIIIVYPLIMRMFTKQPLPRFFKSMLPVQLLAFSTSSSAATLPLTLETVINKLKVSEKTASFVLPVGVTINMDGTSCYQIISVVFIAQVLGINLDWQQLLLLITMSTISSIGTPGVPGGSIVVLVMVLSSVGIPAEGLALILGVDRPLDMLRTVVNVTGNAAVAAIVDKKNK